MAELLTPTTLWSDFVVEKDFSPRREEAYVLGDVTVEKFYIRGRQIDGGAVEIYFLVAKNNSETVKPALIVFGDYSAEIDERTAVNFAKRGYDVFAVDFSGKAEGKKVYTVYPEQLAYADYENAKNSLFNLSDVKTSCFYEWSATSRYLLSYVESLGYDRIGAIGYRGGAFNVWQLASSGKIDCAVALYNAGWNTYKKGLRFSDEVEEQMTEDEFIVNAGIEPQAYASHVKCPLYFATATNDIEYDVDRASDTLSRISGKIDSYLYYFVGKNGLPFDVAKSVGIFLKEKLLAEKKKIASEREAKIKIKSGVAEIKVELESDEKAELYLSSGVEDPALRTWHKIVCGKNSDGIAIFSVDLDQVYKKFYYYVKISNKNGFVFCTPICCSNAGEKILNETRIGGALLYSSTTERSELTFVPTFSSPLSGSVAEVKSGPMDIDGVDVSQSVSVFKINLPQNKPKSDAILMFDVYSEESTELTVVYVFDVRGAAVEFFATVKNDGGVWHNVMIEMQKFKTVEGRPLKNYDLLNEIVFKTNGKTLINNLLWI